jgi:hypothetical protein
MNIRLPSCTVTDERARTRAAPFGEMWSGSVQNAAERRLPATRYLETRTFHLDALQPLENPQNRLSFLWKCLEKTSGYLERLGKTLEVCLCSATTKQFESA